MAAAATWLASKGSDKAVGTGLVAALAYLIVFAIAAGVYNGDIMDPAGNPASCGLGGGDNTDYEYGASFVLFIIAFVFAVAGAIMARSTISA